MLQKNPQADLKMNGVDLDHCRNRESGEITAEARADLDLLNSYSEVSPSGTGLRILSKGAISGDGEGRRKGGVEIYQSGRYLTITGNRLKEYPATIEERPAEITAFCQKHFCDETGQAVESDKESTIVEKMTDAEIIAKASGSKNGDKFKRLMDGDISGYPSASEADEALCCVLAFFTRSHEQIERIWGQSRLAKRGKFSRPDYRVRTIGAALNMVTERYDPDLSKEPLATALELTKDLAARAKADPRVLKDLRVLDALAVIRREDPIEFDLLMKAVKAGGIKKATIDVELDKIDKKNQEDENQLPIKEFTPETRSWAHEILESGQFPDYWVEIFNRRHQGD